MIELRGVYRPSTKSYTSRQARAGLKRPGTQAHDAAENGNVQSAGTDGSSGEDARAGGSNTPVATSYVAWLAGARGLERRITYADGRVFLEERDERLGLTKQVELPFNLCSC